MSPSMTTSRPAFQFGRPAAVSRRQLLSCVGGLTAASALPISWAQPLTMPSSSRELWQWVRTQPVMDLHPTFLDTARIGPTLRAAMVAEYRAREMQSSAVAGGANGRDWTVEAQRLAQRYAQFLGCEPEEVLFTHGAGEALSLVVQGLELAPGDEIITTTREHPAALAPLLVLARRRAVIVKQVELPLPLVGPEQALGLIAGAVTDRTKLIVFAHVEYADGALLPVRDLCQFARQRGIASLVDGAQALGMLDFQIRDLDCDFYACSFHKWLLGSHGTGALYVRREMLDRLWPMEPRDLAAVEPTLAGTADPQLRTMLKLGNVVHHLWPALRGSEAALEFHQQVGRSRIEARVRELAIYARLRLQQMPGLEILTPGRPGLWGGILTVRPQNRSTADLHMYLSRGHRVFVEHVRWSQGDALRASMHVFNSHDDIDKFARALELALKS